ncbi:MAG: hypothetical protein EPO21_06970 [Chloroflexota bacterium]|nr:MAG: hypothetical protein EPO21_06970 [Chloroflexota bacterium]
MGRTQQLYELQMADLEIDEKTEELARVEERLQEPEWLIEARERLGAQREKDQALRKRQRELEYTSEDLREKIAELDDKLYSGRVRNPKELSGFQQEADALKKQRSKVEDGLLELMLELEEVERECGTELAELDQLEQRWRGEHEQLEAERQRLKQDLARSEARRATLMERIPQSDYRLYTTLRKERAGKAVAKVERSMCAGCRISMSTVEIHRARTSPEPIRCGSCGRILYVT